MRFMALACDYDGTLAHHGRVDEATIAALERCVESGRKLLMVTGRELPELKQVFPRLDLFEWIVAENGALLYQPKTRKEQPLGPPPTEQFVGALRARGVAPISTGRVIVATWQPHEKTVLETIRDFGLELQVIFNKGAVMILPSGINKATGLQAALHLMGLSPHDAISIGDAENDHALLTACEAGVATANAVPTLKSHADWVTRKDHGAGVQEIIDLLVHENLAELAAKLARHHLLLGHTESGDEYRLAPYRGNVLIAGTSGGGKSTVATALLERLCGGGYQVCVIDPEGDYDDFAGLISVGDAKQPPTVDALLKLLESPQECVAVNLVGVRFEDRPAFFVSLLARLQELRSRVGRPHWIIVDEAHHVWPVGWQPGDLARPYLLDRTAFITLQPKLLPHTVLETVELMLAIGKSPAETLAEFATEVGIASPRLDTADLEQGYMMAWETRSSEAPIKVKIAPASAQRRRHIRKYAEGELPPDRSLYFKGKEGKLNLRAQNLIVFLQLAAGIDEETWLHHLGRGDYSRWLTSEVKDPDLAAEVAKIETDHELSAKQSRDLVSSLIRDRYTLPAAPDAALGARTSLATSNGQPPQPAAMRPLASAVAKPA